MAGISGRGGLEECRRSRGRAAGGEAFGYALLNVGFADLLAGREFGTADGALVFFFDFPTRLGVCWWGGGSRCQRVLSEG